MLSELELRKLAGLSKLYIEGDKLEAFQTQLGEIIEFAGIVCSAEENAAEEEKAFTLAELREDIAEPSTDRELLLKNANGKANGFFVAGGESR